MQLDGSFQVPAPRLLVWEGIRDPALMAKLDAVAGRVLSS